MEKPPEVDDVTWARISEKLKPEATQTTMLMASMFLGAFELLKGSVVLAPAVFDFPENGPTGPFVTGYVEGKLKRTARFDAQIAPHLNRKRPDYFMAGAAWLRASGVIDEAEADELLALRKYRNEVAHELAKFVFFPDHELDARRYTRLVQLLQKIERWQAQTDIACHEEFIDQEVKDEDVHTGATMVVDLMTRAFIQFADPSREL